jgi:hypothetical protein
MLTTCPLLTTGTAQVALLAGRNDAGAWHRAVLIANRLIAAGRYDWRVQGGVEFFDVYAIDALDVEQLQEGVHYVLGRVAPYTDTEKAQLKECEAAMEQQRAAEKAEKAEPDEKLASVLALAADMGFPRLHPFEAETLAIGLQRGAVLARDGRIIVTLLDQPLTITQGMIMIGMATYSPEEYARCFSGL